MSFSIIVNNDSNHTLTFDKNTLARRNEANVAVTVTVPAAVFALGSFAYVDFVLPDGTAYYKGDYDPSSGSFTFTLGSADVILQQDGRIGIQFVLRDAAVNPTVVWKSELKYALIGASADATAQALTGIPAPATFPATFPAANTSIVDAGNLFASPDVEDALQEVGTDIVALQTATTATNLMTAIKTVDGAGSGLDADLLDGHNTDYFGAISYGTFVPTIPATSVTYTTQTGKYTKIGNVVFITIFLEVATITPDGASYVLIADLPFAALSGVYAQLTTSWSGFNIGKSTMSGYVMPNSTNMGLVGCTDNAAYADIPQSGWADGDRIIVSGFYYTA